MTDMPPMTAFNILHDPEEASSVATNTPRNPHNNAPGHSPRNSCHDQEGSIATKTVDISIQKVRAANSKIGHLSICQSTPRHDGHMHISNATSIRFRNAAVWGKGHTTISPNTSKAGKVRICRE